MTRISSDTRGAQRADAERSGGSRFRRAFTALVVSLTVFCAVFVTLGYLQGPKLADAQVDAQAVTSQSGQQLRLFANQPIAEITADQVTVTPEAQVSVTTAGDVIAVQFDTPLNYATDYVVRVEGVRSTSLPQEGAFEYRFTTGSPQLYYLDRNPDGPDQILRTTLAGPESTAVHSDDRILEFAVVGQALAVLSLEPDDTTTLELVSLTDGAVEELLMPEPGRISDLSASTVGFTVGFVFTPDATAADPLGGRQLLVVDLNLGRALTPVAGLDGEPLVVADWQFVPGSTRLVAQSSEQTMLLVETSEVSAAGEGDADGAGATPGIPTPLGQFDSLEGFTKDGSTMVVRDAFGAISVSLVDGSETRFEPSLVEGGPPFIGDVQPLSNGWMVEKAALQTDSGAFIVLLAVDDGTTGRVLYVTPDAAGSIESFGVSPNDQLVVAEVVPHISATVSDGYPGDPRSTTVTTLLIDVMTGAIVRTLEGIGVQFAG